MSSFLPNQDLRLPTSIILTSGPTESTTTFSTIKQTTSSPCWWSSSLSQSFILGKWCLGSSLCLQVCFHLEIFWWTYPNIVFGLLYCGSSLQSQMKSIKKKHPSIVLISAFFFGYFIIYEVLTLEKSSKNWSKNFS